METIRITTSQNIDIDYELAGLGERIVGRILDIALFVVLYFIAVIAAVALSSASEKIGLVVTITLVVMFVFYDLVCELTMNGQSIGKKVMKIRVISLDGGQPGFGQYLLRWLFRMIDFTLTAQLCGLILVAVTDKKQRLGDIVAGTIMIKTQARTNIAQIAFAPQSEDYQPVFNEAKMLTDREIELIHEVILTYHKTTNPDLIYGMANKVKLHIGVTLPAGMNELEFLRTIIKDYNHLTGQAHL